MATTYTLISSTTLTGSQATVTFSSIPGTYTDLVLRISARTDRSVEFEFIKITLNNDSSALYSLVNIRSSGTATGTSSDSTTSFSQYQVINGNTSVSNTFSSGEFYIPSYTASQNKQMSGFWTQEDNITSAYISTTANLYRSTSTINRIDFAPKYGTNFVTGSSFYLYGIKNS